MDENAVDHADQTGPRVAVNRERGQSSSVASEVPAVLYRVDEAAVALRLSKSLIYELIRSGRLRTVKQGRRRLVPVEALGEYVDSLGGAP